ncbi:MAG TPA: ribosome-associated translation inhibitor RaiA [Candidatus Galloscillospira excrementipullorum]|nr:ribosome-associated translation inhibitor RaiA [Candidatus Galloscillospira excrementipullorum]
MDITITTKKFHLSDELRARIDKKLSKLDRYFRDDAQATVRLSTQKNDEIAEVTVVSGGLQVRAETRSNEMFHSLEEAVDNLERQLQKHKTRLTQRLQSGAFDGMAVTVEEEEPFSLIKEKHFQLKPMDVEEAILQMNLLGHSFFVYRDAQQGAVCVVYHRKDGGYGQIVAE